MAKQHRDICSVSPFPEGCGRESEEKKNTHQPKKVELVGILLNRIKENSYEYIYIYKHIYDIYIFVIYA